MTSLSPQPDKPQAMIDNTIGDPARCTPLVLGDNDFASITDKVTGIVAGKPTIGWWVLFAVALSLLIMFGRLIGYQLTTGVGVSGDNQPVSWGFPIINYVFWIGIGNAGMLISAILLLFRQKWRTGINRLAETISIFAVLCAGFFMVIQVGRPWLLYWLLPIPNQMSLWPQFRSPFLWNVYAFCVFAIVSLMFWYVGMIPDLATLRDRCRSKFGQIVYGLFSLGWTGSSRHWHRYNKAYWLLAVLMVPLVLGTQAVLSVNLAISPLSGWHATILSFYFVAGAVYSGLAMIIILAVAARAILGLREIVTDRHIENCCKIMLGTGLFVIFVYVMEFFIAWHSGQHYEGAAFLNRVLGPYQWAYLVMIFCNCIGPQMLWFKRARRNMFTIVFAAICVSIGMWFDRFVAVVTSLHRDYLPSSWAEFSPTWIDLGMLVGSFGLFFTLFLLFCMFLPVVAMAEIKTVMPQADYRPNRPTIEMGDRQ